MITIANLIIQGILMVYIAFCFCVFILTQKENESLMIIQKKLYLCNKLTFHMKKIFLLISLTVMLFFSCGNKEKSGQEQTQVIDTIPMMIMQIRKCSKLYTAEYHVHKIVTHTDQLKLKGSILQQVFNIQLPIGDRKVAIPMNATLKASVDFSQFSSSNIRRNGQKIEIILPDPEVAMTSSRIDHENVKKHVSILRSNFTDAEMTNLEKQGRAAILNSVPKMGIIEMAKDNAARTIIPMVVQMGFKEEDITITFRKQFTTSDLPRLFDMGTVEKLKN